MSRYIAAIDIGTTAAKALLVDERGTVSNTVSVALQTRQGENGAVTQDPQSWFDALRFAAGEWWAAGVRPEAVQLIAPCGQMQNLVALDVSGEPVGAALLYSDRRAVAEAAAIEARFGQAALRVRLGNPIDAGSLPPKLLRWRAEAPEAYRRAAKVLLGAKDFLIARLTGSCVVDATTASTTGLYRLFDGCWDIDLLTALQIDPALLPRILPAAGTAGTVSVAAATATGFAAGTPVMCGLGDAAATAEGAALAAADGGQWYLYLGTTAWIAGTVPLNESPAAADSTATTDTTAAPIPPGAFRLAGAEPGRMILIAPVLNGGCVLDWSLRLLGHHPGDDPDPYFRRFEAALDLAAAALAPSPLFLPFLSGERCPVATRGAGGSFLGIGTDTGREQLLRAVLDGSALTLRWCGELLPMGNTATGLPVVGGGTRFRPWLQTIADALARPLLPQPAADRLTALGVAALAARTLGWTSPRFETVNSATSLTTPVQPTAEGVLRLAAVYPRFRRAAGIVSQIGDD